MAAQFHLQVPFEDVDLDAFSGPCGNVPVTRENFAACHRTDHGLRVLPRDFPKGVPQILHHLATVLALNQVLLKGGKHALHADQDHVLDDVCARRCGSVACEVSLEGDHRGRDFLFNLPLSQALVTSATAIQSFDTGERRVV